MSIISRDKTKKALAKIEAKGIVCGANTAKGFHCLHPRGFGTEHEGEGRCLQHDGLANATPVTQYKIPALAERMEDFLHDKDIYSLDREIALLRSYLELYNYYLQLFKELQGLTALKNSIDGNGDELPGQIQFTPADLNTAINQTTKTIATLVKTKNDIEISRKYVIELKTVELMFTKIAEIIDIEIDDSLLKNKIGNRIGQLMLTGS